MRYMSHVNLCIYCSAQPDMFPKQMCRNVRYTSVNSQSRQALSPQLPVVMRVPRFSAWALNMCGMQFSILGFGDIIVPGEIQNIGI